MILNNKILLLLKLQYIPHRYINQLIKVHIGF